MTQAIAEYQEVQQDLTFSFTEQPVEIDATEPIPERQLYLGDYDADDVISYLARYKSDEGFIPPIPSTPITHLPGTWEKVEELRKRIERGQHLWHESDAVAKDPVQIRAEILGVDREDLD